MLHRPIPKPDKYRPEKFEDYIGQEKAKNILQTYIKGVKERKLPFPHTLIHGPAGTGKTTLARLIGKELNLPIKESIGLANNWSWDLVRSRTPIIFIDEIHSLSRDTVEQCYTFMEDYMVHERYVPFTLIGATTELGEILKDRKPFYDRFRIIIELDDYNVGDIVKILQIYKDKTFPADAVPTEAYQILAENARGTPRTAIRLLEGTVYFSGDYQSVLANFGFIKKGYTEKDLKALQYIAENQGGVGLQGLATLLGTSMENYLYEVEPYLVQTGCITRTARGRKITNTGLEIIDELSTC